MATQPKMTEAKGKGYGEKVLRRLSRFLQQKTAGWSKRKGIKWLSAYAVLSTVACIIIIFQSVHHPKSEPWKIDPIKAFPLPPPGNDLPGRKDKKDTVRMLIQDSITRDRPGKIK